MRSDPSIDDYNRERPHQALKYRTPHEVRREALECSTAASAWLKFS